jgi:hypothetical protein
MTEVQTHKQRKKGVQRKVVTAKSYPRGSQRRCYKPRECDYFITNVELAKKHGQDPESFPLDVPWKNCLKGPDGFANCRRRLPPHEKLNFQYTVVYEKGPRIYTDIMTKTYNVRKAVDKFLREDWDRLRIKKEKVDQ